ncbi:pirin family protein [Rhizobium oryzicola]|uniref:Pirin family protein n=1 Tax=Rhizobium oryzicola TaxID=1232668 RepID=A0ABT8T3G1_9HYPH|nr:pirin family protein [Rhizobium oryzicola]MDO1585294.1 pirin family protein [Rhizobium oryzicola]
MILIHDGMSRGHTNTGWLNSYHTFSFGSFQDPTRMGYGPLRVINEDRIVPGSGFSEHAHAEMDILTLVLSGKLTHKDTLGNIATIAPGEAQLMYAGNGIRHSEMNASGDEPAHFLQIWLIPDRQGGEARYQQVALPSPEASRNWTVLASGQDEQAPLRLNSDSRVLIANPLDGMSTSVPTKPGRLTFLHIVEGLALFDGERLTSGDGLQITNEQAPDLTWITDGQALLFDMPQ